MISILIPVYNTPYEWIYQCHMSIMRQSFTKFEIIYVNDGSTNLETLNFFNEIKDNRIVKIINLEKNVGIAKALNIGLKECKYEYVARMDSDDIMYNNRLLYQYDYLYKNPNVDLVGSGIEYYKYINGKWIIENNTNFHPNIITPDILSKSDWVINHPTVMFKKNKILSIGGYNEQLYGYAEDYDLWARMLLNDMVLHNIRYNLVMFRFSDDSLSHKFVEDNKTHIKNLQKQIIYKFGLSQEVNEEIKEEIPIKKIETNMKIGFLVIATNKYIRFVKPLVDSINKYFLVDYDKTIFCFTDQMDYELQDNVIKVYQEHMNWPLPTLKRYEIFYRNAKEYSDIDILYYLDADMLINSTIGTEILPDERGLVAVVHPGYLKDKIQTYERNPLSNAYVNNNHYVYHCGGVQGGIKSKYIAVCKTLMININDDMSKGIIAVWHDESHWNCYLINNPTSYKELDSSYCYPESWQLNIPRRILALDKNHSEIRN